MRKGAAFFSIFILQFFTICILPYELQAASHELLPHLLNSLE
jgi:hypothetical protein